MDECICENWYQPCHTGNSAQTDMESIIRPHELVCRLTQKGLVLPMTLKSITLS